MKILVNQSPMVLFNTIYNTYIVLIISYTFSDNLNDTSSEISSVSSYRTSRYNIFIKLII